MNSRKFYKSYHHVQFVLFILASLILMTCEKLEYERVIKVGTGIVSNPTSNSATIGGIIIDLGEGEIMQHGHCWSTNPNPTVDLATKTQMGVKNVRSTFISNLTKLLPNTTYYVKAYATNAQGTAYGKQVDFKTPGIPPVAAFTAAPTTINAGQSVQFTDQSANSPTSWSWNFGDGGTSTLQNPSHTYSTAGAYTVTFTATNSFGSDPETKTNFITVNAVGSAPVAAFTAEPTTITAGQSVQFTDQSANSPTSWSWNFGDGGTSTLQNPSHTYSTAGIYTVTITATNSFGSDPETKTDFISVLREYKLEYVSGNNQTYYGGGMPSPMVFKIKNVTDNVYVTNLSSENLSLSSTATVGYQDASFNNQGNYCGNGDNACYGGFYFVELNPGPAYILSILVSLKRNDQVVSDYIIQANITICTSVGSFTDSRDGHVYDWIKIGEQIWMTENMAYLPVVSPPTVGSTTSAYYYVVGYEGTSVSSAKLTSDYATYGVLYNWPAAMAGAGSSNSNPSGVQGVCPSGWHLPSDAEWVQLNDFLEGEFVAGGKMKSTSTPPWAEPNNDATNTSGFSGLPGGYRNKSDNVFSQVTTYAMFWSSLESTSVDAKGRGLFNENARLYNYPYPKDHGFSVRCIKD